MKVVKDRSEKLYIWANLKIDTLWNVYSRNTAKMIFLTILYGLLRVFEIRTGM